ncbi:MAG: hypothetical protein A3I77_02475 [Gammaproteobacteria bacterium RIFCSPLOWO2_02_FULL_42_14]|nr:MAG: hypothetical protein A3B71_02315 [Gammaproteobacteria bacterium RIFCSPHIGHO2_02_FULL_42_43]OGT28312.1 MAG: hypothetical protein A2624_01525 [Gammaproteobacteria bacterium RIFCSPHIGHO2_01_FULL_42_8]OGT53519.1 MAG: hypothetical protein A3E54_02340 [Gammaproteobacteria bacterium RIFCSPHIGHO2_12_FULL_41_25]OGT61465.1 MAG: hypothetical protein A3I77_02475 [Gammaproteobacteria bacterium RIFCSPLOWO2_02_FULL_42_14]OGT86471.1 MAG: hypothetical protein A3G86_02440 [Gammaproteobacteria bacterium R
MDLPLKKYLFLCITLLLGIMLTACMTKPSVYPTAGEQIQNTLNSSIQTDRAMSRTNTVSRSASSSPRLKNDLLPPLVLNGPANAAPLEHRFNVTANDMPAKNFFLGLVAGTNENMIISPNAAGTITLNLKNVTIDQALDAARDIYGYQYKKTDTGYEILPKEMITRVFNINYLNINRAGQSQTQLISTEITNENTGSSSAATNSAPTAPGTVSAQNNVMQGSGSTVVTREQNDFWTGLSDTLKTLVGTKEGRWVVTNPQASVVMVHAYPDELHQISGYLQAMQKNLQREVIIEAKILEITLDDNYQAGINWKILGAVQNSVNGLSSDFASDGQAFSLKINGNNSDFNSVINLLSQQGNVQVLSSPRISTINNQEAVIKVGNDQFFVTGYTSNIVPSNSSTTTSQSIALNPFFSGITLDVIPQISGDGAVTLYIHPSISTVKDQNKTIQLGSSSGGNVTLPLALSSIRESDNVVKAQNGQIVVIGGLMQNSMSETIAGTPGLTKLPMLGTLGRNTNQIAKKTELVILLRPILVQNSKTWVNDLQATARQFQIVQRGYHAGGLSEDFGSLGERPVTRR